MSLRNFLGETALHTAAKHADVELCDVLINADSEGTLVHAVDNQGYTALHIASSTTSPELVDLLLNYGASPRSVDATNSTPVHIAAALSGSAPVLDLLLRHGGSAHSRNGVGASAIHLAVLHDLHESVSCLLRHVVATASDECGESDTDVCTKAAISAKSTKVLKVLSRYGMWI